MHRRDEDVMARKKVQKCAMNPSPDNFLHIILLLMAYFLTELHLGQYT